MLITCRNAYKRIKKEADVPATDGAEATPVKATPRTRKRKQTAADDDEDAADGQTDMTESPSKKKSKSKVAAEELGLKVEVDD